MHPRTTVIFVDNDQATTQQLSELVHKMGLRYESFESGLEFLETYDCKNPSCVVLETRTSDVSGLQVQHVLRERGCLVPIIFLTSLGSISLAAKALRAGAVHFLEKPVNEQDFWDAVQEAIAVDEKWRHERAHADKLREWLARLTKQERVVLDLIANGKPNKHIAGQLDVSIRTVEIRRSSLMVKLEAKSIADLIRIALLGRNGHSNPYVKGLLPAHLSSSNGNLLEGKTAE